MDAVGDDTTQEGRWPVWKLAVLLYVFAAGAVAGWRLVGGLDEEDAGSVGNWPWQAATAGALAALVWVGGAWLARGDLGTGRLVGMGPAFPEIVWLALFPMSLAAGTVGLVRHLHGLGIVLLSIERTACVGSKGAGK